MEAKGKKDRITLLSETVLVILRKYYKVYKLKEWLFEGQSGKQYSKRSVQKIFKINRDRHLFLLRLLLRRHRIDICQE